MGCGAAGFIVFRIIDIPIPKEVITIFLSFFGYLVVPEKVLAVKKCSFYEKPPLLLVKLAEEFNASKIEFFV